MFLHPGFLFIAVALISVPIVIHLINRMRFKRVRWAAMEFLLKAQKRTRRRLIIEQLLLLALRCLLIALVGIPLLSRFVGCGDSNTGGRPNLHIALIDDTVSMQDEWKQEGLKKNCFDVAKADVLVKKIAKGLSQSKTNDRLILLPLSKLDDPDFTPMVYERLNDPQKLKELTQDINELQPSMRHVNMLQGVKEVQRKMAEFPESRVTLHILSDFRSKDWSLPAAEGLMKELLDLVKNTKDVKIRPIDTAYPARSPNQGAPTSHDNVGIIDVRPSTRIVGKNTPVEFTVAIKNFSGKLVEVNLIARDENSGKDMLEIDFNPQNPIKLSPTSVTTVTFEKRFTPEIPANESYFAHLSVRLTDQAMQPLGNDGLLADNLRHTVVEVRDKVPILVVDSLNARDGRLRSEEDRDRFFISRSLISVPGASYQVVYGDDLPGCAGDPAKALERADLSKYPTIFVLAANLKPKQAANLETYVKEGGGVAFFLGDTVNAIDYNKLLYKDGKGIFPAPLSPTYFPSPNEPALEPKGSDTYQLLVRDDKFGGDQEPRATPIFGKMFAEPKHREPLRDLPIRRYWKVPRQQWKTEHAVELATLPNEAAAQSYGEVVADITQRGQPVKDILANPELAKYRPRLQQHLNEIEKLARPGSEAKAYHLASQIDFALKDQGNVQAKEPGTNMTEFWANGDDKVQALRRELVNLREQVAYGDPFIITQNFKKGKVVAVMSSAGKDWNDWAGGSAAQVLYPAFIWELQNYLSDPGTQANLTVGTNLELTLDAEQFKGAQLKLVRHFLKPEHEKPAQRVNKVEQVAPPADATGHIRFEMKKNLEPGVYVSELIDENAPGKTPLAVYAHAFNVDTEREGDLQRIGTEELNRELIEKSEGAIRLVAPGMADDILIGKLNDFSESPWLFLLLLLVLVAEQALAVHLSFHLRGNENEAAPTGVKA